MNKKIIVSLLATLILMTVHLADAQEAKVYRIGVLLPGDAWYETIEGLRSGLRELGFEEGKQFVLTIRDTKGDIKAAEGGGETSRTRKSRPDIYGLHLGHHSSKAGDGGHPHRFLCRGRPG
jgi:ABC-type uncharacterized transport system substrate-binding protein